MAVELLGTIRVTYQTLPLRCLQLAAVSLGCSQPAIAQFFLGQVGVSVARFRNFVNFNRV